MNFPSVRGGQGLSKGRWGLAWGKGGWLEAWNKGAGAWGGSLRAWGLERAEGLGWGGTFGRTEIPHYGLVLTGGHYHDIERYHDFKIMICIIMITNVSESKRVQRPRIDPALKSS